MLKKTLSVAALCSILASESLVAQTTQADQLDKTDSTNYQSRKLKLEEVNFVTGYYQQDGNNAAVTGGIGDEHLTDVANTFNISLSKYDKKQLKHSINLDFGIDVYTSASSDQIDPSTISSASSGDVRFYPSINYTISNEKKRYSFGGGLSYSGEYDYTSYGTNVHFSKWSKDNNKELSLKASVFLDQWKVILPIELRSMGYNEGTSRNSYNFGLIYYRVINKNFQMAFLADFAYQEGLLGTKFHRVYFDDNSVKTETLPTTRTKIPLGIRANYYLGDNIVLRGFYRYYWDNWDIKSNTMSLELSYKITPFISLAPSYRFYNQTETKYFAPYQSHNPTETFYTSDYDLSKFNSNMYGLNLRFSNLHDKTFLKRLNVIELRYSYYDRSTALKAHSITLSINYK